MPIVDAIIPTIGRPELARAVRSAASQTLPTRPVVVLDRPDRRGDVERMLDGLDYRLIVTKGAIGGGGSRNLGTRESDSPFVAYLDDDDEWLPRKSEEQVSAASSAKPFISSTLAELVGNKVRIVPERPYQSGQHMADYLLDRSTIRLRRNFMQTSSLLMPREVAINVGWDESLPKHQDWDLLIRAHAAGVHFGTIDKVLVRVFQHSAGSISQMPRWRASEDWLNHRARPSTPQARSDFLASIVLRGALQARELRQAGRVALLAARGGCHPAAMIVGLLGALR
ncbi:glycosyltransferase family 2 protein [Microbacterium sp. F1-18]